MELPNKKYNIIYADPPWQFSSRIHQENRGFTHSLEKHYSTMTEQEICSIPIKNITDENCILFMWVTDSHLEQALKVIAAWGFHYKTIGFTWVKHYASGSYCYNFSPYLLKSTEICLIATKGKLKEIKEKNDIKGLVFAERTKHSKKPQEVRARIEQMCKDLPRIELFARQKTPGWDVWGNEV
jgi:N6-adenosine-specific RNA methylase IME4|tara:strand:+ start:14451 stop:14999 length:549 start_codon:yes stop_codon:yes gene_type:complete